MEKSPAQSPYYQKFVSIHHRGSRRRWCTGRGICDAINNISGSHSQSLV